MTLFSDDKKKTKDCMENNVLPQDFKVYKLGNPNQTNAKPKTQFKKPPSQNSCSYAGVRNSSGFMKTFVTFTEE